MQGWLNISIDYTDRLKENRQYLQRKQSIKFSTHSFLKGKEVIKLSLKGNLMKLSASYRKHRTVQEMSYFCGETSGTFSLKSKIRYTYSESPILFILILECPANSLQVWCEDGTKPTILVIYKPYYNLPKSLKESNIKLPEFRMFARWADMLVAYLNNLSSSSPMKS